MKKINYAIIGMLTILVIGIFLIHETKQETNVTKEETKVGFLLNGSCSDSSYGQSHYEGMEKVAKTLNLNVIYRENVPETDECFETIEALIKEGCEIIICNSFGFGEWALEAAEKYPEIYFFHATGIEKTNNLSTYFGRMYQVRYLSGIVAGLQTKTNEIGYVAAFPISEVNRGINAFTLGVRKVNPDAVVYVKWSNSWIDDIETALAANALIENHEIDVLAMHTDSLEVLDIAEEKGIWSIGYNRDNSEKYPNTFLTAPIWQWEHFYEPYILECLQGKYISRHFWEGIESGMVALAPLTDNAEEGIAEAVEKEQKRLESMTMDVFYGPIKDQSGTIRIQEGESMTDYAMLNEFDWYVEGVQIEE
uniref:BMP family ABC transporter substrate-binding protein n=1 Tax=Agathobacter sp. TaxID=2021311 RepID=UPI0040573921